MFPHMVINAAYSNLACLYSLNEGSDVRQLRTKGMEKERSYENIAFNLFSCFGMFSLNIFCCLKKEFFKIEEKEDELLFL